jgi:hypothetical protein
MGAFLGQMAAELRNLPKSLLKPPATPPAGKTRRGEAKA